MEQIDGDPTTSADLRALAFGGLGHFTTMRVEAGSTRGLDLHLARLVADCRALFDTELSPDLVRARIRSAIADEPDTVVVRVTVFDPALTLERPGADADPAILVSPRRASTGAPVPLRLRSAAFERQAPEIKHVGLFGTLHQRRLAQRAGYDDAVFVGADGALSEGPTWNIGFIDRDDVVWPDGPALPGVTRALLADRVPSRFVPVDIADLGGVEAAFATSSGTGIRPIAAIDDHSWPTDHAMFDRLRAAYAAVPIDRI